MGFKNYRNSTQAADVALHNCQGEVVGCNFNLFHLAS